MLAHRAAWLIHNGPIPDGQWVLHKCDNPPCVRPSHLFLGTAVDNARDMSAKERGSNKLTTQQVNDIHEALAAGVAQRSLARHYGVCQGTISHVATGRNWNHSASRGGSTTKKPVKMTYALAEEIRRKYASGAERMPLAVAYGVSYALIHLICARKIWKSATTNRGRKPTAPPPGR